MRSQELERFAQSDYLNDGHPHVLNNARPYFEALIKDLAALPEGSATEDRLAAFRRCVEALNGMGEDIETLERECFCSVLYALGDIVQLNRGSAFVENWRGDW